MTAIGFGSSLMKDIVQVPLEPNLLNGTILLIGYYAPENHTTLLLRMKRKGQKKGIPALRTTSTTTAGERAEAKF